MPAFNFLIQTDLLAFCKHSASVLVLPSQDGADYKCNGHMELLEDVKEQIFKEVEQEYKEKGTLSDDLLVSLEHIYGAPLLQALDLVDRSNVKLLTSPSERAVYQVTGSSGLIYTCPRYSQYCTCPAYKYSALNFSKLSGSVMVSDQSKCKHRLAIRLSEAMNVCQEQTVSNAEITKIISQIE